MIGRIKKLSLRQTALLLSAFILLGVGAYFLVGPPVLKAAYAQQAGPLNRLINGQDRYPVEHFIDLANIQVTKLSIYLILPCLALALPRKGQLALCSTAFTLLAIEAFGQVQTKRLEKQYASSHKGEGDIMWEHDPVLGWRKEANTEKVFSNVRNRYRGEVRTNAQGLRDDDIQAEADRYRILLLGDSIVAGLEVNKEQVLDTRMETHFLAADRKVEVINAGTRGYGTDQSLLWFEREGKALKPDLVIYVYAYNDPINNITIHKPNRKFGKAYFAETVDGQLMLQGTPIPESFAPFDRYLLSHPELESWFNQRLVEHERVKQARNEARPYSLLAAIEKDILHRSWLYQRMSEALRSPPPGERMNLEQQYIAARDTPELSQGAAFEQRLLTKLIQRMRSQAASVGASFFVHEATSGIGQAPEQPTTLALLCQKAAIDYHECLDDFYLASKGSTKFCYRFDAHWNAEGHDLAAQALVHEVLRRNEIP